MVKCKCGCGVTFDETKGRYVIPMVGSIRIECYDRIVPKKHRGSYLAVRIIQNYVKINE